MQSHLILHLVAAVTQTITSDGLPHFCGWPIQYALAHLITLPEGQILKQSFSHYLVHIELLEHIFNKETTISFTRDEATIFMFFMFEGHSSLYDHEEEFISKVEGGCCYIGYNDKGNYHATLNAGEHKLLLLTLRPDWFMRKAENLNEFKPLVAHYTAKTQPVFTLPYCPLNRDILRLIRRLLLQKESNPDSLDILINGLLIQLIGQYNKMLVDNKYITAVLHQIKATAIENYIQENFTDKTVEDIPGMAQKFNVSERLLFELAKLAFGKPIREYVIDLRMDYALRLLETTTTSIHEIAFLAGYNDPGYFSKAFKKHHSRSPSEVTRPEK